MAGVRHIIFIILTFQSQVEGLQTFDFLDYKDVPVENSGWLKLKQDPDNPLYLPHSFAFCINYFPWYRRSSYVGFLTIILLDKERNYRSEFTLAQHYDMRPLIWEYSKRRFNYVPEDKGNEKHKVKSYQWAHVCGFLDMKTKLFSFYIDGVYMGDTAISDEKGAGPVITFDEKQQFDLYIGTHRTVPGNMANRIIGMMHGFNMYTYIDQEMLKNISSCKYQEQGDFVSWETADWINIGNESLIMTKELELAEICPARKPDEETVFVIPLPILDYQSALDRCKALTMAMTVPFNNEEHEKIISGGNSEAMVKHCFYGGRQLVLFAMQMSATGRYFDPQTNITTNDYAKSQGAWYLAKFYDEKVTKGKDQVLYGYTGIYLSLIHI